MKPTEKSKATKRNLWPAGVILAFVLFLAGTIGLVVMACSQKMDLVSQDYYEKEIRFQNQLDQLGRTMALEDRASVSYEGDAHCIRISVPSAHARAGAKGIVELYRPSAAGLDRRITLEVDATGCQRIAAGSLRLGLWKVRVSWTANEKQYLIDEKVVVGTAPVLKTTTFTETPPAASGL
jgi:nitrogen fixation protein FixH